MNTITKKVIILGDSDVGKTSIIDRYVRKEFNDLSMPTIGAYFKTKEVEIPNTNSVVKLSLWDTAGQEKFKSLTRMYFMDADAAIIVYDVTYKESLDSAKKWIQEVMEYTSSDS